MSETADVYAQARKHILKEVEMSNLGPAHDNHANQLNPNNDAFWESRGWGSRPEDWEERSEEKTKELLPNTTDPLSEK